ncbi:alpha-L-fucosidase [Saccharibacillus endophyticus]|uniref:alpha-L-fucosidase n=1 Tax=Saccharibacillus endophyticus TaxID=2060666 RepID=A0ABQ1ZXA8_9BACL|nr:alpha-L-fucosidase [Saccharibacillus endophyticus]GGH79063.1 alpha-L-fucosidase [Saccharibacillus endophyticus]
MDRSSYLKQIRQTIERGSFKDDWESLSRFEVPQWYKQAKFGIFIHWGLYSVPAYDSEWYSRNMYIQDSKAYNHHIETYGKHADFGYKDFIPMFTADKFDASEWANLFKQAGARYVMPVAEHHDGFQMYKSEVSTYNAFDRGPKRDLLGEMKQAFDEKELVLCASSHRAEHWFFMSHGKEFESDIREPLEIGDFYWPAAPEPDHHDLFSPAPSEEFLEDWLIRTCEIVDVYQPKVMYFDWWIQHSAFKPYLKTFAAYYYNKGEEWGTPVAINYKHDAYMFGSAVPDVERGQFAELKPYYWQTDTAVAKNSWCYTEGNDYKASVEIIRDLVDIVSKNGNLLLNVGPKADGSIPEEDRQILLDIGAWLHANGEAIYDSTYWRISGEGPTQIVEGQFTDGETKRYTSEDIRFTLKGSTLYATVLVYPENGRVAIRSLKSDSHHFAGLIRKIGVLGFKEKVNWERTSEALILQTESIASSVPVVFKIELD